VIGADLAPDAVIAALEQITEGIKQKGIPKEKVVEAKPVRVPASKPKPQK
jgi:hypothetical protein